jgi:CheY-like chemotaxis protein
MWASMRSSRLLVDRSNGQLALECFEGLAGQILINDDKSNGCEMMSRRLTSSGCEVIEAENGQNALEKLEQHQPPPIPLDVMMPLSDGCQFLNKVPRAG